MGPLALFFGWDRCVRSPRQPVIVTGGASGIGQATARLLGALGCRVTVADHTVRRRETVARIRATAAALFVDTDVTDIPRLARCGESVRVRTAAWRGQCRGCACAASASPERWRISILYRRQPARGVPVDAPPDRGVLPQRREASSMSRKPPRPWACHAVQTTARRRPA